MQSTRRLRRSGLGGAAARVTRTGGLRGASQSRRWVARAPERTMTSPHGEGRSHLLLLRAWGTAPSMMGRLPGGGRHRRPGGGARMATTRRHRGGPLGRCPLLTRATGRRRRAGEGGAILRSPVGRDGVVALGASITPPGRCRLRRTGGTASPPLPATARAQAGGTRPLGLPRMGGGIGGVTLRAVAPPLPGPRVVAGGGTTRRRREGAVAALSGSSPRGMAAGRVRIEPGGARAAAPLRATSEGCGT